MSVVPQIIVNSLIAGGIYALVAVSFNLIYDATKFFNLAHGAIGIVGGYIGFACAELLGWSLYVSIILGVLGAGAAGYLTEVLVYLPLRKRKASTMSLLVASLGIFSLIEAILAIAFTSQFQSLNIAPPRYAVFGTSISLVQAVMVGAGIVVPLLLLALLKTTAFGKAVRATSDDEEVARIVGIDTNRIIGKLFFIGSAVAGVAAILAFLDTGIEPTQGLMLLVRGVIAAIVGGIGTLSGGLLGGFLLGFVENFGILNISGEWKDAIAFGLLILFLMFRPEGIIKRK